MHDNLYAYMTNLYKHQKGEIGAVINLPSQVDSLILKWEPDTNMACSFLV